MCDMNGKVVTRSVRFEQEFDARLEREATERGITVSALIRATLADAWEREARRERLERALQVAADLPDVPLDRDAMWRTGERVSG
jgi:predicted DNA-binding ribbon-helix-helix protein